MHPTEGDHLYTPNQYHFTETHWKELPYWERDRAQQSGQPRTEDLGVAGLDEGPKKRRRENKYVVYLF